MNRHCPSCDKIINYKTLSQLNDARKNNRVCKGCVNRNRAYKGTLTRICNICNDNFTFSSYRHYRRSIKNRKKYICKSCVERITHTGKSISDKHKKILRALRLGKQLNELTKQKISYKNKGQNNPCYGRTGKLNPMYGKCGKLSPTYRIIAWNKGKQMSEEARKNMRIAKIKRFEKLGIQAGEDKGAKEWFDEYNKNNYTNFKPKRFFEIGYDADGYDEKLHIWIEYDTKYHKLLKVKEKDLIRQKNIIKYFESINNPLNQFIRIDATDNNKMSIVYKK